MNSKQGILILFLLLGLATFEIQGQEVRSFSLQEAKDYAIDNSYKSRIAEYDVTESEYQVKQTMAMGLPQLNGNVDYTYNFALPVQLLPAEIVGGEPGDFQEIQFGTKNSMVAGATLQQLIFDGTYLVGVKGAKVYSELVRQQKGATDYEVKKNTADAYYLSIVAVENHKMLLENQVEIKKQLYETSIMYDNGLVEELKVDQLKLNAGKIRIEVQNAARQMLISHNMLKFQMGIVLSDSIVLSEDIQELINNASLEIAGRYGYDVSDNIQYRVADEWVNVRDMQIRLEKAKYLPSLNAMLNVTGSSYVDSFNYFEGANWYGSSYLGVSMKVPIFSGMDRYNGVQRARVNSDIMRVQREQTEASLNLELTSSNANFNQALAAFNISLENVEVAKKIRDRTNRKFQEGLASSFDVTIAQTQLINDQFELVGSALNLFEAKTKIDQILNN